MQAEDLIKIIMNPTRLRIVQYLMINPSGTVKQIQNELKDVPTASLYRHVKILEKANLILVVQENRVRGAVEKVYELNKKNPMGDADPNELGPQLINSGLFRLIDSFTRYFARNDADPQKDFLFLSTSTLLLTDDEFKEFTAKLGEAFNSVIQNKAGEGRKVRRFTIISSPEEQ